MSQGILNRVRKWEAALPPVLAETGKYSIVRITVLILAMVTFNNLKASASLLTSEEGITPVRSAEYVRTQSRNSSTDIDAVYFNPAGLAFMQSGGIHIMLNLQNTFVQKKSSVILSGFQNIDALNNFTAPMMNRYLSPSIITTRMLLPTPTDLDFVIKKDKWALFFSASLLQGYPGVIYSLDGLPWDRALIAYNTVLASSHLSQQFASAANNSYLRRNEIHIGATIGGSYSFTDWFSSALALRYIYIQANSRVSQLPYSVQFANGASADGFQFPIRINTDVGGHGAGIIAGFDFKLNDTVNIGTRIEYYPPMVLTKRTNEFIANPVIAQSGQLNIFSDSIWPLLKNDRSNPNNLGNILNIVIMDPRTLKDISNKYKVTYPPSFSAGFSYQIIPRLKITTSADLTFPRARDLDGRERDWLPVGYRFGQSIEWNASAWAVASAGYSYHDFGIRPEKRTAYDDLLASHTVGAGCTFKPLEMLDVTAGASYSFYRAAKNSNVDIVTSTIMGSPFVYGQAWNQKLSRKEWSVSLSVSYSIYPISTDNMKKAEYHYRKGIANYNLNDIDSAIDEFEEVRLYNPYYKNIDKKIRDLIELNKLKKMNIQQEEEEMDTIKKNRNKKSENEK